MVNPRPRFLVIPALISATLLFLVVHAAAAQPTTGTITGRVLWGPCIRGIPLPAQPAAPDAQSQPAQPVPMPAPVTSGLPAGAVLVAVQNTAISARTDETGRFTLSDVPAGQYMTVAAGPVADSVSAVAERPNVFVNGGDTVDVGTLSLGGGPTPLSIACRVLPGASAAPGVEATPPDSESSTPAPDTSNP